MTPVDLAPWNAMGAGAIAVNGSRAYIAALVSQQVAALDVNSRSVVKTFAVDPDPRALAIDTGRNHLTVLAEDTGTLDVVDLTSYSVVERMNAWETERQGTWNLPFVAFVSPASASAETTVELTIQRSNLQSVAGIDFDLMGEAGGGMGEDWNFIVIGVHVNTDGSTITTSIQILAGVAPGPRQLQLRTDRGDVMGAMAGTTFTVTAR